MSGRRKVLFTNVEGFERFEELRDESVVHLKNFAIAQKASIGRNRFEVAIIFAAEKKTCQQTEDLIK